MSMYIVSVSVLVFPEASGFQPTRVSDWTVWKDSLTHNTNVDSMTLKKTITKVNYCMSNNIEWLSFLLPFLYNKDSTDQAKKST